MKNTTNGHNADFLRRKAKALKKQTGISHKQALDEVVKDFGFQRWEDFIRGCVIGAQPKNIVLRPKTPNPSVLDYHDVIRGTVIGQHPNAKMSVKRHARVGSLLHDLLCAAEYHKFAKRYLEDIRSILDTWLGCEYNEEALPTEEFNKIYYAKTWVWLEAIPSEKKLAKLKRQLREAKRIIDISYHGCRPLDKLHERFLMAEKAVNKWPKSIKEPKFERAKTQIPAGMFVRLKKTKKIGLVFRHNKRSNAMDVYTDAGYMTCGRHEVSVLRAQPNLLDFKPQRLYLPYGKWKCADGKEILFNRDYCPIWEKLANGEVKNISPDVTVPYKIIEAYYDDRTAPYYGNNESLKKCLSVLKDWGVPNQLPEVFKLVAEALEAGDVRLLSPKGFS